MRISLKKNLVPLILILPALLISPVRDQLDFLLIFENYNSYFLSIIILLTPFFLFKFLLKKKFEIPILGSILLFCFLNLTNLESQEGLNIFISVLSPILLSYLMVYSASSSQITDIIKIFLKVFILYILLNIILFKSGFLPENEQNRMGGSFAEIVSLSYSLVILLPLYYYFFKDQKIYQVLFLAIAIYAIYLTQTRTSIYLAVIFLFYIIYQKYKNSSFIILLGLLLTLGLLLIEYYVISKTSSRIFNFNNIERINSIFTGITFFWDQNFLDKLIGVGFNEFYKYEEWIKNGQNFWDNKFFYKNNISLIQPHNSYIWFLVESGFLGLLLIFNLLIRKLHFQISYDSIHHFLNLSGFLIIICCFFDSTLLLYPNVTLLFWFLIFSRIRLANTLKQ